MLAHLGMLIQLAWGNVVAHSVHLVVGGPDVALRPDRDSSRVAMALGVNSAPCSIQAIEAQHGSDAQLFEQCHLVSRLHVVWLAHRHVDLAVLVDLANAPCMVERLLFHRNQLAFGNDHADGDVRAFIEILSSWEVENPVRLGHHQESVLREANAVRVAEFDRGCKNLDLSRRIAVVAVGYCVDIGLARADKQHVGRGRNSHVSGVRHHSVQIDFEAFRQLDLLQVGANGVGVLAFLGNGSQRHARRGIAHALQRRQVGVLRPVLSVNRCCRQCGNCQGK